MASGAVYDDDTVVQEFSTKRYELVLDLIEARDQCVVAFNWTHQRDALLKLAKAGVNDLVKLQKEAISK